MNTHKEKLEIEKVQIENDLNGIAKKNDQTGIWDAIPEENRPQESDMNDQADHNEEYEERTAIVNELSKRLSSIEKALIKIETDRYGFCEECGNEIEEDRLEANPSAATCKSCM